ncbi:leucine-rich repeat domain-containing protein [Actinomadura craniellae]|uniref:Leucine-rich repeat domain-containing protein n=1 Tax=Actinomadura craniellae TaxID=2231787 RepID=A0A365GVP0_9ACTN|nr:STM4015 family protein [Actinomadura craniellae]RAY10881.1 leucine-rich repeat domain-containing protein [Actinomadura craniellae]
MSLSEHCAEFAGLRVVDFTDETPGPDLPPAASVAWRIRVGWNESTSRYLEKFERFLERVDVSRVSALIIGYCGGGYELDKPVARLAAAADRFPDLRALFVGEILAEEAEISWIMQTDVTPLLAAFPLLERFEVRGGSELELSPVKSTALRVLRMETGGLPREVVRAVGESDLPNLEHLELWLGVAEYGGDATVADLAPILAGERLPSLRYLGLEDSEIQDEIATAVAGAPVVARLETLSLPMGTLGDEGAEALLSGQPLTHLKKLDLSHHFLSDEMTQRIRAALPGVEIDLRGAQVEDEWRYVAVSE